MKQELESKINKNGILLTSRRNFGRQSLLFKNMYVSMLEGKKISYMTDKSVYSISKQFKQMFDVNVKCIRQNKISVKLILENNDRKF